MNCSRERHTTYLFRYFSASLCHVRWCSLCTPFGVFISMQREAYPFLGTKSIKSDTPRITPCLFNFVAVIMFLSSPLGTAKSITERQGYCKRNHLMQDSCISASLFFIIRLLFLTNFFLGFFGMMFSIKRVPFTFIQLSIKFTL